MEQISCDKYNSFKSLVMSKVIREVDDCKDIQIAIHTTLNCMEKEYNLSGWIKNIPNNSLYSITTDPNKNFDKIIVDAKKVTIIARNMANIYNMYQTELENSIKSGCLYRVLVLDYNEETKHILCNKFPDYGEHSYQNHIATHDNLKRLQTKYPNFEYKSTHNVLDYSIISIEYEQNIENFIQILLYTRTMIGGQRPMFKVAYDNEWYNKFENEIDDLWKDKNNFICI